MSQGKESEKETYRNTIKKYITPTIALFTIGLLKLHAVGALQEIYLWLTGQPMYTENDTIGLIGVFILVILDMLIGIIYVWISRIGKGIKTEGMSDEKDSRELTVNEALKKTIDGDGVKRGFNYLWMTSLGGVLVSVLWSLVTFISLSLFKGMIIQNPTEYLTVFAVMTGLRVVISAVIKVGVLAYTVNATVGESNVLKAWWFTTLNLFKIVWIELRYISITVLGLALLVVGVLGTHAIAVEKRVARWETLVRNYERDRLYGTFK